jgi:hypothetical protein
VCGQGALARTGILTVHSLPLHSAGPAGQLMGSSPPTVVWGGRADLDAASCTV